MTKKEEEFWKLAQEMLAQKDFSRIKELEELKEILPKYKDYTQVNVKKSELIK